MIEIIIILSPVIAAGISPFMNQYWLTILSVFAIFIAINVCRYSKRHENLWLFVLVGIALIPTNIKLSVYVSDYLESLLVDGFFMKLLYIPLAFAILFSVEEILLGVIGRLIWKDQDPVFE